MAQQQDIVISGFPEGIGDSSHVGFADMRNIDVYTEPGVARVNYELREATFNSSAQDADGSTTFTANAGTDVVTTANGNPFLHDWTGTSFAIPVTVSNSGGALPAGLAANTVYYIFNQTSNTEFQLASTYALADAGTVAGTGTAWTAAMAGRFIRITDADAANKGDGNWYEISSVASGTSMTLLQGYQGTSIAAGNAAYVIGHPSR